VPSDNEFGVAGDDLPLMSPRSQ